MIPNKGLVIVDFYASRCGPCKMIMPILEDVVSRIDDVELFKINIDEEKELSQKYEITSIPTLMIFKDGELKMRQTGTDIDNIINSLGNYR